MRAIVLDGPGPPEALAIRTLPVPEPRAGWVLIRVEAFGLNRSELHTRLGLAEGVTFPRVPGIECVGVVEAAPGGEFRAGRQVAAILGGMGRTFDGGYAEYALVPERQVIPFASDLPWETLGAIPEMLQTAHGALTRGLGLEPGQTLLIRGGTSSVGLAAAALAADLGATVISTTRRPERAGALREHGAAHVVVDSGEIASAVRALVPVGVDAALELVGSNVLRDTVACVRPCGTVCFTGMLSNQWIVPDFYPIDFLPDWIRLTGYGGGTGDYSARDLLPPETLQDCLDRVAGGSLHLPIHRVYAFDELAEAHREMEAGRAVGKLVVRVRRSR